MLLDGVQRQLLKQFRDVAQGFSGKQPYLNAVFRQANQNDVNIVFLNLEGADFLLAGSRSEAELAFGAVADGRHVSGEAAVH